MLNALSVDVEDWFQVGAFEKVIDRTSWDARESRVERNTDAVLALFSDAGVKATFFTLGWVAERFPDLMMRIAEGGHEIASHGWDHARLSTLNAATFRADLERASIAIENACGRAPKGYRAPSFSLDAGTSWAHEVLAGEGYAYSSSVAPIRHDHYGWPESSRSPWRPVAGSDMVELPVTTLRLGPLNLAAGGGFFRLLPYALSNLAVRRANRTGDAAIFYFHPWEIDPGQPRVDDAPLRSRLRHYSRLCAMKGKLARLLRAHSWVPTAQVADLARARLQ